MQNANKQAETKRSYMKSNKIVFKKIMRIIRNESWGQTGTFTASHKDTQTHTERKTTH